MSQSQRQKEQEQKAFSHRVLIHKGHIIDLYSDTYRYADRIQNAEIIEHPGAAVILPIDAEGNLFLVQQWRRAAKRILYELPAGTLEPNEDPLICARRELREETGFDSQKITSIGGFYTAPGFCNEYLHLFLAQDLFLNPLPLDEDEGIDLIRISLEKTREMILNNEICDAKTIAGILRYMLLLKGGDHA